MLRLIFTCAAAALLASPSAVARAQSDGPRNLYVIEIEGTWTASIGSQTITLKALAPVSSAARLQLSAGDQSDSKIVLRDPRTLFLRRRLCTTAKPCGGQPIAVTQLETVKTGLAATAQAAGLYADLGERAQLRDRVRLVGARSTERDIGIVIVTRDGARIDLREILARVQQPADRLVARFCSLTDPNIDETECIESRRRAPADCDLTSSQCELAAGDGVGAYRVDVYVRERSMLGSLAVASGFAAVVPVATRDAASTRRDELTQTLKQLAQGLNAEELRAVSAAATFSVAGVKR
jgi:hypothetical protein